MLRIVNDIYTHDRQTDIMNDQPLFVHEIKSLKHFDFDNSYIRLDMIFVTRERSSNLHSLIEVVSPTRVKYRPLRGTSGWTYVNPTLCRNF